MVFSTVRSPSLKLSFSHMTFCPCGVIQSVSPFLLKVSSTYDMFPKSHMKYSLHQLIWVSSWKICCHCLSINWKRFNFLFNSFFSFWNLLELNCHCSINLWIVTFSLYLLQNIWNTCNSHGCNPRLVLENWNIPLPGG